MFLLCRLVRLFVTAHEGVLAAVKLLGEVGESGYRAVPSAAYAPTSYTTPGLTLHGAAPLQCFASH